MRLVCSTVPFLPVLALFAIFFMAASSVSAQGISGTGPRVKPNPFVSRENQVLTSTSFASVAQGLLAREVKSRPLDRQLCAGIADHGTSLVSRFLYSQSYRSADEVCTLSTQVPCYTNSQQISAPNDGLYTRFVSDIQVSGATQFRGSPTSPLQVSVDYVAADGSSTAAGECATFLLACPPGASCQQMKERVRLTYTISNVRVGSRLVPICLSPTGGSGYAPGSTSCDMPASYVPIDGAYTGSSAPAACEGGTDCLTSSSDNCHTTPCEPDDFVAPGVVSALLDGNCGPERDPDQGLLPELNQHCALATCGACADISSPDSQHGRFAAGPITRAYQSTSPSEFLADLTVEVAVTDQSTGTTTTRVVTMTDVGRGEVAMNIEGDRAVRVSILDILGNTELSGYDVSSGVFYISDYEAANDIDAGQPTGFFQQTSDPSINPWRAYPNAAAGLTPTATNIAAAPGAPGLTSGWSYQPARSNVGSRPGQYGVSQARLTSPNADFGSDESCAVDDYFSRFRLVPGWDTGDETSNTAGTAGGPAPLILSPLQCSAINNKLTADVLAGVAPDILAPQMESCLPPGYNLLAPGDYISNGYFWRQLFDGSAYLKTPAQEILAVAPEGYFASDYMVGDAANLVNNLGRSRNAITVATDVSEDLAQYGGAASASSISQSGTGCLFSTSVGGGMAAVTVENLDEINTITYTVTADCRPYSGSLYGVDNLTPSTPQLLTVGANSIAQVTPVYTFDLVDFDQEGTGLGYGDASQPSPVCDDAQADCSVANVTIACTFQIFNGNVDNTLPDATFTALCSDLDPSPADSAAPVPRVKPTATPGPTDSGTDTAAISAAAVLVGLAIGVLSLIFLIVVCVICVKACTGGDKKGKAS